jgi:hypothetical protein
MKIWREGCKEVTTALAGATAGIGTAESVELWTATEFVKTRWPLAIALKRAWIQRHPNLGGAEPTTLRLTARYL